MRPDRKFICLLCIFERNKGHNYISSCCSAIKPGVSRPPMQVHIPVKWQYNLKIQYQDMSPDRRTDGKASDGQRQNNITPKSFGGG